MKYLLAGIAIVAVIIAAGSALAADLLLRAAAPAYAAHWAAHGPRELGVIRPPHSVEGFASAEGRSVVAAQAPNERDVRVLDFLRWKDQHRTASGGR
jgi:hypothetical protein